MKKKWMVSTLLCGSLALGMGLNTSAETYEGYTQEEFDALDKTTVIKSEDSPTGYYVTFRYKDSDAERVRIFGEWAFSDLDHSTVVTSLNATPEEWKDGYTVWQTTGWPTADMTLDEETGIWSYTIPLPNGTYNYRFYVDGAEGAEVTDYTDAEMVCDPSNPNFTYDRQTEDMTKEMYLTSVYVPYDEVKQANTTCVEEQAPRDSENGTVFFENVTLDSGISTSYGVYLPYEFDKNREDPYPILVLFHGGGGYDGSWFNNGLANILDNMIAEGRLEPTIVVTPNGESFPAENPDLRWDRDAISNYVIDYLLPHMSEEYNASTEPAHRAIGGLSQGGAAIMNAYFNHTDEFDYYIDMSSPMKENVHADFTKEELNDVNLFIGYGMYDFVTTQVYFNEEKAAVEGSIYEYIYGLSEANVNFMVKNDLPYGHQWSLWRELAVYAFDNFLWK